MDSLLASYASSDEDDEQHQRPNQQQEQIRHQETDYPSQTTNPSSSLFSSLPPPKSSLFNSLPPPKSPNLPNPSQTSQSSKPSTQFKEEEEEGDSGLGKQQSSSVFSSLPQPKSSSPLFSFLPPPKTHEPDSKPPKPKRVVQFRPPINAALLKSRGVDSDDEDDREERERERKRSKESTETPTVKSFLSSIPAPKNSVSLGSLPSSGSGRRSIIEADVQASTYKEIKTDNEVNEDVSVDSNAGNYEGQLVQESYSTSMEAPSGSSDYAVGGGSDPSYWAPNNENPVNYDSHGYGNYADYGQYKGNWVDRSGATAAPEISEMTESLMKVPGKRGRTEIPQDIIEVRQDELIKDRPREDKSKLTGIAFGPSYQPASSAKGKPTKLHKRKHQIGSLYFDMRQKEMELAERRAKGFLTKSETQAKYGW